MVIEFIKQELENNLFIYYGLDWITILFEIIRDLFIKEKKLVRFLFNAISVTLVATVAIIASQYGFLIANRI